MSRHPGPWALKMSGEVIDDDGAIVFKVATTDPEARAVLLHAAEMWEQLKNICSLSSERHYQNAVDHMIELLRKIEAEISAGRKP